MRKLLCKNSLYSQENAYKWVISLPGLGPEILTKKKGTASQVSFVIIGKMFITAFLWNTYEQLILLLLLKRTMDYIARLPFKSLLVQTDRSYIFLQENMMF